MHQAGAADNNPFTGHVRHKTGAPWENLAMKHFVRIATRWCRPALLVLAACTPMSLPAASVAELSELARQATFEVVLPKIEPGNVKYEKPLPLELLSFSERNDKYWSIGTAFAIAPDVFVSNAHVLSSGLASPMGKPHLRDAAGKAFPVDRILKFSLHEDFIVFRARGASAARQFTPGMETPVGARVFAVGNALGEGVVVRDGLLTSLTPEDQDGRWKWLRFSAATSPGNSGGPLLDEQGRVIGVVTARSPGENLNYALPIGRVLEGSERTGGIDVRSSFGLPILRQQMVSEFKADFALPVSWEEFVQRLQQLNDREYKANQARLLQQQAAQLPPGGNSSRLLASVDQNLYLALIGQQSDDSWFLTEPDDTEDTTLADEVTLRIGSLAGAFSFQWWTDASESDPTLHRDATAFMDSLLKGMKIPRMIGPQAIRVTSLGAPQHQSLHTDRFSRIWQLRSWSFGYADMQVVTLALPVPDGYIGLIRLTSAINHGSTVDSLLLMADYMHASYEGSMGQWHAFVAQRELCPPFLRDLRFGKESGTVLAIDGLDVKVAEKVMPVNAGSRLAVYMGYQAGGGRLTARPAGLTIWESAGEETSWVGIWAQPKPADNAGAELKKRWASMSAREGEFDGKPRHNPDNTRFWSTSVMGDATQQLQFEVTISLKDKLLLPRHVAERRDALQGDLVVTGE